MPLDYFNLPIFHGGTGIAQLGEDFYGAAQAYTEGQRRKRAEAEAMRRQDALERHQMAQEANAANLATIAEKRQLAAEDFTRGQTDLMNRRDNAREQRDALTFEQQQADRRKATVQDIGRAFGQGRPLQAKAIAGAGRFVDPRTGQMQGVQLEEIQPPPDSGKAMPIEPKPPEFVGPLEDPESARVRAMGKVFAPQGQEHPGMVFVDQQDNGVAHLQSDNIDDVFDVPLSQLPAGAREGQWIPDPRGAQNQPPQFDPAKADEAERAGAAAASEVTAQQAARDQYGRERTAYPGQLEAFNAAEKAQAERVADPRYRVTFPGGESVEGDPREERKAVLAEAKDRADKLRQGAASQPPDVARSMMLQADLIESTISNADKAPVTNMNAAVQAQGFKGEQADKDREIKREGIRAKKIARGLGAGGGAGYKGNTAIEKSLENFKRTVQWNKLVPADRSLRAAMANLSGAGPDQQIKHKDAQIQMARYFRGTTPTEGEMALLYNNLGGKLGNGFQAFIERMSTGDLTPVEIRALQESIKTARTEHQEALDNTREAARLYFNDPTFKNAGPSVNAKLKGMFKAVGIDAEDFIGDPKAPPKAKPEAAAQSPAAAPAAGHPSTEPVGATKTIGNKVFRKVGPNNWQPVTQ